MSAGFILMSIAWAISTVCNLYLLNKLMNKD